MGSLKGLYTRRPRNTCKIEADGSCSHACNSIRGQWHRSLINELMSFWPKDGNILFSCTHNTLSIAIPRPHVHELRVIHVLCRFNPRQWRGRGCNPPWVFLEWPLSNAARGHSIYIYPYPYTFHIQTLRMWPIETVMCQCPNGVSIYFHDTDHLIV